MFWLTRTPRWRTHSRTLQAAGPSTPRPTRASRTTSLTVCGVVGPRSAADTWRRPQPPAVLRAEPVPLRPWQDLHHQQLRPRGWMRDVMWWLIGRRRTTATCRRCLAACRRFGAGLRVRSMAASSVCTAALCLRHGTRRWAASRLLWVCTRPTTTPVRCRHCDGVALTFGCSDHLQPVHQHGCAAD